MCCQLRKYYDNLKVLGYAEPDDFQEATEELDSIGMTPFEVAKLRSMSATTPISKSLATTKVILSFRSGYTDCSNVVCDVL